VAISVKSASASAQKWRERAGSSGDDYAEGAVNAAQDWESATVAASGNYRAAVTQGNIQQRYERGVREAGAEKYRRKVADVGAARYSQGVAVAEADYESGVQPYLNTIASLTLPPRQPRGSAANLERVKVITDALHRRRIGASAAGR